MKMVFISLVASTQNSKQVSNLVFYATQNWELLIINAVKDPQSVFDLMDRTPETPPTHRTGSFWCSSHNDRHFEDPFGTIIHSQLFFLFLFLSRLEKKVVKYVSCCFTGITICCNVSCITLFYLICILLVLPLLF